MYQASWLIHYFFQSKTKLENKIKNNYQPSVTIARNMQFIMEFRTSHFSIPQHHFTANNFMWRDKVKKSLFFIFNLHAQLLAITTIRVSGFHNI
jgi:hypothetical protein